MTTANRNRTLSFLGRAAVVVLYLVGIILSGRFADLWDGAALIFVVGGTIALTLMGFSFSQIGVAARSIAGRRLLEKEKFFLSHFWEALGRNFWIVGVLGSLISFVLSMVQGQGGIRDITFRLASSFQPAAYGLVLGIFCGLSSIKPRLGASPFKLPDQAVQSNQSHSEKASFLRAETGIGLLLMLAIVFGITLFRLRQDPTRNFSATIFFLDWPAVLVVVGGTIVVTISLAPKAWGTSITVVSASMGFIGAILGFIKALLALSHASISDVAGSIAFIISSCFLALLIMVFLGLPLSDWERRASHSVVTAPLIRQSWYVFPLVVLLFLVLAFVLVVTPFQKPA